MRSSVIWAPVGCTADAMLNTAIRVAVRSSLMERTPLTSTFPLPSRLRVLVLRTVLVDVADPLIGPTPVFLLLQDVEVSYGVFDSFALVAHVVASVGPRHLHGDATACDRHRVERTQKNVDLQYIVRTMCLMSSPKSRLCIMEGGKKRNWS